MMFVKLYRYKVKKRDFKKSQKISKLAEKIYKKYGLKKAITLFHSEKYFVKVILIEFYKSKDNFEKIIEKVNKDIQINNLWQQFTKLVPKNKIISEEFEYSD